MKNIRLIISVLLLLLLGTANLNGQTYRSSLGLHYGLFQYNNAQNEYFFDADGNFLNAGLSYKYKLGRLSSLSFTGRYYDWNVSDFQTLNTQSLQGMWLIHAGRISSSWRVNLITPYIGAGIGFEMHSLSENGSDQDFNNFYLPLEAGININIGPRWSLGIFAEYKMDRASDLKNRLGLSDNYQGVVSSAGVTISYHFGQRTTELVVPMVTTNPYFILTDDMEIDVESEEIAEIKTVPSDEKETAPDTLVIAERLQFEKTEIDTLVMGEETEVKEKDSLIVEKTDKIIVTEMVKTVMDTLRIPIVIDLNVKGLDEETGRPLTMVADKPAETRVLDSKIDSLIRMTGQLNQRIALLERTPAGQVTEREIQTLQPIVVDQGRQPYPVTTQVQLPPVQPAPVYVAESVPAEPLDAEGFATKNDIETLRAEIRQLAADNREAMSSLRRDIRVVSISDQRVLEDIETEKPDFAEPIDTIQEPVDTIPDIAVEMEELIEDSIKHDEPGPELQAVLDSLAAIERSLAAELEMLQQQNLELMEELATVEMITDEETLEKDERITMEYSVTFGVNSARLSDDHINQIAEFAKVMMDNSDLKIQLSGYADGTGDPEYNKLLSQWRVQAVKDELIRLGVPQVRILEQYFGSENATGGLNPEERRVDMRIL
ncbi:MAG: OmpA family protein [Bacteroidales bacterium]|nr:OmpA family protein [Bacteroidales bacterium]